MIIVYKGLKMLEKIALKSIDKSDFRKKSFNELRKISSRRYRDYEIVSYIIFLIELLKPKNILTYLPMNHEVDISRLNRYLRRKKAINVFVPKLYKDSFQAISYRYPLRKNRFNIYEPISNSTYGFNNIDLAIIPIVGVDKSFRRVGFGKGMYDRFFYNRRDKTIKIFTQLKLNYTKSIVTDSYDIEPNYIVSHKIAINVKRLNNGNRVNIRSINSHY
jgi:5-formyltetrahydrofolate cyclo-ligase